jgi:hypothetical protein
VAVADHMDQDLNIYAKFLESQMISACYYGIPDTGFWILDEKENRFFVVIRHRASSNQHRFASNNGFLFSSTRRFEVELCA